MPSRIVWIRWARAGSKPRRTAIASFGRGSDRQTISVALLSSLPDSIIAVRLRSKSVAQSACPLATAISFAACVAPSAYWKYSFCSMPLVLNHAVGMSQPEVEPTSANDTRRPLASCGQLLTPPPGRHTTMAWEIGLPSYFAVAVAVTAEALLARVEPHRPIHATVTWWFGVA